MATRNPASRGEDVPERAADAAGTRVPIAADAGTADRTKALAGNL
jgi:hypothetical protein